MTPTYLEAGLCEDYKSTQRRQKAIGTIDAPIRLTDLVYPVTRIPSEGDGKSEIPRREEKTLAKLKPKNKNCVPAMRTANKGVRNNRENHIAPFSTMVRQVQK